MGGDFLSTEAHQQLSKIGVGERNLLFLIGIKLTYLPKLGGNQSL